MDNLEKFIMNNRGSLDRYDPSPEIWERIHKNYRNRKRILLISLSSAATIALVLGIGITAYNLSDRSRLTDIPGDSNRQQLKETEFFYNTQINSLYLEAKPLLTGQPEIERELDIDLARIDKICSEIQKDLEDNVSNQEVIEALIRNYTTKIRLLEEMLVTLKENENIKEKGKSNEL